MDINQILDEIERAYPVDMFPPTTPEERAIIIAQYPGFIDRTSAMMGRHLVQLIRAQLAEQDEDQA